VSTTEKNLLNSNISSTCPQSMVNFGPLTAEINSGDPSKFQRVSRLGFVTAATSLNAGQPNFARCLAVSCIGRLYTLLEAFAPNGILPRAKFTVSKSCVYIFSVTARHRSSERQPNFCAWYKEWNYRTFAPRHIEQPAPPIFHRAAITLGIGPHSGSFYISREA